MGAQPAESACFSKFVLVTNGSVRYCMSAAIFRRCAGLPSTARSAGKIDLRKRRGCRQASRRENTGGAGIV